jgi:Tol biopolymer transport system component
MRINVCSRVGRLAAMVLLFSYHSLFAQFLQPVSVPDPVQPPPAGGGGDSSAPLISPDGRFVLFASTASNLALTTNGTPMAARFPAILNVFLRDRTNATTTLVSANLSGCGGNGDSLPAGLSADGRYALFVSSASDLVPDDTNNATDVFVRDLVNASTTCVSVNTNGVAAGGSSRSPAMTPDARYVAFVSLANDLVPGHINNISDIYVRDLQAGVTTLASPGAVAAGGNILTSRSEAPDITPDGRYVAFFSTATGLVTGAPGGGDIYVRDLVGGTTIWASAGARAALRLSAQSTAAVCFNHVISSNGQFVAYEASTFPALGSTSSSWGYVLLYCLTNGVTTLIHTNAAVSTAAYEDICSLDMTPDGRFVTFIANTNGTMGANTCALLWDEQSSALTLLSGDSSNHVQSASLCDAPAIEPSGRFVAFLSNATNLTANPTSGNYHLYLRDTLIPATIMLDADTNGFGSVISPVIIPQVGSNLLVSFEMADGNLVPNDRNHAGDVFVRDVVAGTAELVSTHLPDLPCATPNAGSSIAAGGVSADGRYVTFTSDADNLTPNDLNMCRDVFVRDLGSGTNVLVSIATNGLSGDGASREPTISPDGGYVAFTSSADNLVSGDSNHLRDVFLRDLRMGTTVMISANTNGISSIYSDSFSPVVSAGGRSVLFWSTARNLAPGSFSGQNLFLRNVQSGSTIALTTGGASAGLITSDGRFVAFVGYIPSVSSIKLYIWDTQTAARVYTNSSTSLSLLALSPDGNRIAYATSSQLNILDRQTGTTFNVGLPPPNTTPPPHFSRDGQRLAFIQGNAGTNQVYLYDIQAGTSQLVSHQFDATTIPATGSSDSPDLSADGRFVAYRSSAIDLLPNNTNGNQKLVLYDSLTGSNSVVSVNVFGNSAANTRSLRPVFSGDGQTLLFESWGFDLVAQDFNQASDLFADTLFYASVLAAVPGEGPEITWKTVPGRTYRVQFKNSLSDLAWQGAVGTTSNFANLAFFRDAAPSGPQRFYRVVSP